MRCLILNIFLLLTLSATATAQGESISPKDTPNPIVHLEAVSSGSFSTIITALSAQTHFTFVAEGVPLHHKTSKETMAILCTADEPFQVKMAKVANAFDYDVEYRKDVCLLRKRYSDPNDLPTVTYEECLHFAIEVERAARPYQKPPELVGFHDPLLPFIKASTAEDIDLFKGEGLPVSQMNAAQRDAVRVLLYDAGFRVGAFSTLPQILRDANGKNAVFTYETMLQIFPFVNLKMYGSYYSAVDRNLPVLGFRTSTSVANWYNFIPINRMNLLDTRDTPALSEIVSSEKWTINDPSDWTPSDITELQERNNIAGATTVGKAIEELSQKVGDSNYQVDDGVKRRQLTVLGMNSDNAKHAIQAVLDLCNLDMSINEGGTHHIAFKHLPKTHTPSDFSASLAAVFPDSVSRYYQAALKRTKRDTQGTEEAVVRKQICKRLRMLVEPKLQKGQRSIRVKDLDPQTAMEVSNLLSMMHMIGLYPTYIFTINYAKWEPFLHFDRLILKGKYDAKQDGSVEETYIFAGRTPNGQILQYGRGEMAIPSLAIRRGAVAAPNEDQ